MTEHPSYNHVRIDDPDRLLASANVVTDASDVSPQVVHAELHVEPGHLPAGTRTRLVDGVLELPEAQEADRLTASAPVGDAEILGRIRERADDVTVRAAGSTMIVAGDLPAVPDSA